MKVFVVFMICLKFIWNIGIQMFLHVACGYLLVVYIFCGWACNWNTIIKSSSLSALSRMFRHNNLICLFWLTFMIFLWLQACIFGKAHLCEVSDFCAVFALVLLSRAVKSLCIWGITKFSTLIWISIIRLVLVWLFLLQGLLWFSTFTGVWFLTAFLLLLW